MNINQLKQYIFKMTFPNELFIKNDDQFVNNLIPLSTVPKNDVIKVNFICGKKRVELGLGVPDNVLILSLSLNNKNYQNDKPNYIVKDIRQIVIDISEALIEKGVQIFNIINGPCIYNDKEINCIIKEKIDIEKELGFNGSNVNINKMFDFVNKYCENDISFSESIDKKREKEYRIIWFVDKLLINNQIENIKVADYFESQN